MNKYGFLAVMIAFCNIPAAQAQVDFGVKAGVNVNTVRYREADSEMASVGFHVGGLAHLPITQSFFIRPEVQYSIKGYRFPALGADGSGTVRFHYIAFPLLAGFPIGNKFGFLIGPEFGFLTKASSKFSTGSRDVTNNFQQFDWGLDLGGTYKITSALGVEVRYNYGFRGLIKGITTDENGGYTGSTKDGANRVLQAGLFYLL